MKSQSIIPFSCAARRHLTLALVLLGFSSYFAIGQDNPNPLRRATEALGNFGRSLTSNSVSITVSGKGAVGGSVTKPTSVQGTPPGVVQGAPGGVVQGAPGGVVQGAPGSVVQGTQPTVVNGTQPQGSGEPSYTVAVSSPRPPSYVLLELPTERFKKQKP